MLPLDPAVPAETMALVGPLADSWYQDWYGGTPPYVTTLRQGMKEIQGTQVPFADGLDRVIFRCGQKGVAAGSGRKIVPVGRTGCLCNGRLGRRQLYLPL